MFSPEFQITPRILEAIAAAERTYQRLKLLSVPPDFSERFKERCLVALTHFSTQIEGNALTFSQVSDLLARSEHAGKPRDEKEVRNYFALLTALPAWQKRHRQKLSPRMICACHRTIQQEIVTGPLLGRFRTVQNAVYHAGGGLAYLPPTPADVPALVKDLCDWCHSGALHPVLTAGILHNQMVTIHPFVDGNGRTARAVSLYWLMGHGWDLRQWVPIDRYYAADRPRYYASLQQAYPHNYYQGRQATDFTPWLEYYAEGLRTTLEETIREVQEFCERAIFLNARQQKIIKTPPKSPVTPRHYAVRFGVSTRMAARDLQKLVQWGYLSPIGKGRSRYYVSP